MTDNEFLLIDRLTKIKSVIEQYGEENFYISFSGGKDSTVLSDIIDLALPDNKIPRVYVDTGIEYSLIRSFVKSKAETDRRFVIIAPSKNIRKTLEEYGYPFKSKVHATYLRRCKENGFSRGVKQYLGILEGKEPWTPENSCPKCLRYQFLGEIPFKVSEKCCDMLKKQPLKYYMKEYKKQYAITGIRAAEGGGRKTATCVVIQREKLKFFNPLAVCTDDFMEWYIKYRCVKLCDLYYPPYNFRRTGCKGCPFNRYLQQEIDTLEKFFPQERKQCEIIWKPVYDEYRRIGYRLRKEQDNGTTV